MALQVSSLLPHLFHMTYLLSRLVMSIWILSLVCWLITFPATISHEIDNYSLEQELSGHSDWVRDVAWAPSILPKTYIASASQDKSVIIWTSDAGGPFQKKVLTMDAVVWRVSWSLSGNVLAVSGGDNKVTLWKENLQGNWEKVTTVEE